MTFNVVSKTADIVVALRYIAACELLMAAQAIDLRAFAARRARLRRARGARRRCARVVPMLDDDRPLGPDARRDRRAGSRRGSFGSSDLL